ncbi:MAG: hypothetical protein IIC06_07190 [Proteobacteria bacterium]|nr:hypothetical protein [Pseudomonadota bacterium]
MAGAAIGARLAHPLSQAALGNVVAWVLVAVGLFISSPILGAWETPWFGGLIG